MTDKPDLLPCPICGADPEVDSGFSDLPHAEPKVFCRTVHVGEGFAQTCPAYGDNPLAWNHMAALAWRRSQETQA